MSARSGISVSDELVQAFTSALNSQDIRFIKASIQNESIITDSTTPISSADLESDLDQLQTILNDDDPSYVLTKLDNDPNAWLAISYVPDTAKVRDKMLYAASRAALTKSLGSGYFTDSLFATCKADLTPQAYEAHRRHSTAPNPLSTREQELEDLRNAEPDKGIASFEGSRARKNHIGTVVGFGWDEATEAALHSLIEKESSHLVIAVIATASEVLNLVSAVDEEPDALGHVLPQAEPSYSFYLWCHEEDGVPQKHLVFIYACPTASNVRSKMLYSSGVGAVMHTAQERLGENLRFSKRIETSDPKDITESRLREELGIGHPTSELTSKSPDVKSFAKPRGPARKR